LWVSFDSESKISYDILKINLSKIEFRAMLESNVRDIPSGGLCCFESYEDAIKSAWGVFCCGIFVLLAGSVLTGVFTGQDNAFVAAIIIGIFISVLGILCCYYIYSQIQKRKIFPKPWRLVFLCEDTGPIIPTTDPVPFAVAAAQDRAYLPQPVVLYTTGQNIQPTFIQPTYQNVVQQQQQVQNVVQQHQVQNVGQQHQVQNVVQQQQVQNIGQQQYIISTTAPINQYYNDDYYKKKKKKRIQKYI